LSGGLGGRGSEFLKVLTKPFNMFRLRYGSSSSKALAGISEGTTLGHPLDRNAPWDVTLPLRLGEEGDCLFQDSTYGKKSTEYVSHRDYDKDQQHRGHCQQDDKRSEFFNF